MRSYEQRTKRFYLFIAFGLAWSLIATMLTEPALPSASFTLFIAIAPLFAAYVLHITSYPQSFLDRSLMRIRPNIWWICALLIPILYGAVLVSTYSLPLLSTVYHPLWVLVFFYCLFQEIGWRAFYQRELHEYSFWFHHLLGRFLPVGIFRSCLCYFKQTDLQIIALICFHLLSAAPLAFMIATSRSVIPAAIMHTLFLLLFILSISFIQAFIVYSSMLLLLNGLIMLMNAVFPQLYKQTFTL
ncbi:LOW QUALITY PROTEIN: CAAX amino terminal protease family protein [Bacillus sp. JCM 19046]|nr:LOW QUALITY PROTEIN: CAAX amino terminal protease family protein [Bacillus sp. JCM 19046]